MEEEFIIINKTAIQKKIEELESKRGSDECSDPRDYSYLCGKIHQLEQVLLFSIPLIPEIEKAMDMAREIKDDSAHDTFTAEDISGCTEVCTYGWRYKTTNEDYISNLKLDI